jgi:hypothetical protein
MTVLDLCLSDSLSLVWRTSVDQLCGAVRAPV